MIPGPLNLLLNIVSTASLCVTSVHETTSQKEIISVL